MISRMSELDQALAILEECKAQLRQEGKAFDEAIRIGIMVEIPSVAILASQFIQKVDFFSIGSNDLTQYTLAVDRMNEKIDYLYDGLDPAVLTLIRASVQAVDQSGGGKTCGLCGELGSDPKAIPILLGAGPPPLERKSIRTAADQAAYFPAAPFRSGACGVPAEPVTPHPASFPLSIPRSEQRGDAHFLFRQNAM